MARSLKTVLWTGLCCSLVISLAWFTWWARTDIGIPSDQINDIDIQRSEAPPAKDSGSAEISGDPSQATPSHKSLIQHEESSLKIDENESLPDWWSAASKTDSAPESITRRRGSNATEIGPQVNPPNKAELEAMIEQRLYEEGKFDIIDKRRTREAIRQEKRMAREVHGEIQHELKVERRELRQILRDVEDQMEREAIEHEIELIDAEMKDQKKAYREMLDTIKSEKEKEDST
jgi:hypothetical protein